MTRPVRRSGRGAGAGSARGVALILVLTTIAILTSIGVDFSYSSRVSLRLAENARDELRAYYLARSAVNLSRLLLHFQKQVDQMGGQIAAQVSNVLAKTSGAPRSCNFWLSAKLTHPRSAPRPPTLSYPCWAAPSA